jgi:hypothetical protein
MNKQLAQSIRLLSIAVAVALLTSCATLSDDERQQKRAELDEMSDSTIASLLETRPEASELLEECSGYAVIKMRVTKIPIVGAGGGYGVVQDERSGARSYIRVSQFEVGGGLGAQQFKVIIFFSDATLLDRALAGAWHFDAAAEASAGDQVAEGQVKSTDDDGYRAFKIGESGAVATATIRAARAKPYLN